MPRFRNGGRHHQRAMVLLHQALKEANLQSKLIAQVHDELVLDVKQEELETVKQIVKEKMEHAAEIGVKLTVDVKSGSIGICRND